MEFATCPRCEFGFSFELGGRTRVSCPNCLRTFDPFAPLPKKRKRIADADAAAGRSDDLVVLRPDDPEPPGDDFEPTPAPDDDDDVEPNEDFEEGL